MEAERNEHKNNDGKNAGYPKWQLQPFRLAQAEIDDPHRVLTGFIESYSLPENRLLLWALLSAALGGSTATFINGKEAGEWMFYCRRLEELVEAVHVMVNKA